MTSGLPHDLQRAVDEHPGMPIALHDQRTAADYVLLPRQQYEQLLDDYIRRELQVAFDQFDRGEVRELDIEATIREAKKRQANEPG